MPALAVVSRRLTAGAKIKISESPSKLAFSWNYKWQQKILLAGPPTDGISAIYNQHLKGAAVHAHNRIGAYCHVFSYYRRAWIDSQICWTFSTHNYDSLAE
jgi:hypothetical protein